MKSKPSKLVHSTPRDAGSGTEGGSGCRTIEICKIVAVKRSQSANRSRKAHHSGPRRRIHQILLLGIAGQIALLRLVIDTPTLLNHVLRPPPKGLRAGGYGERDEHDEHGVLRRCGTALMPEKAIDQIGHLRSPWRNGVGPIGEDYWQMPICQCPT